MTSLLHLELPGCRTTEVDTLDATWTRLADAVRPGIEWLLATIEVSPGRARALWQHGEAVSGEIPSMLWLEPGGGERWVALGSAVAVEVIGSDRAGPLMRGVERVWRSVESLALPGHALVLPRLVGGLSFAPGARRDGVWRDFPDAGFSLPRWLYAERDGRALLTHAIHFTELRNGTAAGVGTSARMGTGSPWKRLLAVAGSLQVLPEDGVEAIPSPQEPASLETPDEATWTERVNQLRPELASGRLHKVVLARRTTLTLDLPIDTAWLIGRLEQESPGCSVFAIRRGESTFLGATPEWLLRLEGRKLETEALAGSCAAAEEPEALLASAKDRAEHELVVSALLDTLSPLTTCLSCRSKPEVLRLRHLLHLRTPISVELRDLHHPLELVERLHPTPAVGGAPTLLALEAIRSFEGSERGWYAAPLGWFDAHGNARFVVGLRSGVVSGNTVHVFAGAGIMPDSKASLESAEVRLKQRAFLHALGVEG